MLTMRLLKRLILLLLAYSIACCWMGYLPIQRSRSASSYPLRVFHKEGSSLTSVANQLADAGVLSNSRLFILLARMKGMASFVKAGDYEFRSQLAA